MSTQPVVTTATDGVVAPAGPGHDLVVLGCSAGGVEALRSVVSALPADLPATVLVVLHLPPSGGLGLLPEILGRSSVLPVSGATDGAVLQPGTVLVAPPNRHLLVEGDHVRLSAGPAENGCRPAIDPLFRSAAHSRRGRVVGVVLTGNLDDGSAGLRAVVRHGGAAVVQDPAGAQFPGMPRHALEAVPTARTASLADLPALIVELVHQPHAEPPAASGDQERFDEVELRLAAGGTAGPDTAAHPGTPSAWSCPDCSGVLWEIQDGPLLRFRCRTGHAWSVGSLVHEQGSGVDTALWIALRALEEQQALAMRVADGAARAGRSWSARHFLARAEEVAAHARVLRRLLAESFPRETP